MKQQKMTDKQQAFADYYIETGNATEAARKAGYRGNNLNRIASENLSKLVIKAYIDEKLEEIKNTRIADATEVLEFLSSVMRGEVNDQFDLDPALNDRLKAADQLFKRYRLGEKQQEETKEEKLDKYFDELRNQIVGDNNGNR